MTYQKDIEINKVHLYDKDKESPILYNLDTGKLFSLNETSLFMWNYIKQKKSYNGILEELQKHFSDCPKDINSEVQIFIDSLVKNKFISFRKI